MQVFIFYIMCVKCSGENYGEYYFFVFKEEFCQMIDDDVFFEYVKVFENYYGILCLVIEQVFVIGVDVFLDIDW